MGGSDELGVRKSPWHFLKHRFKQVYLSHGYGRTSGVGQHRTQQQTVLEYGSGYPHGGVEVGIVAAVFFGIPVVVPFAEEGEDRRQTHGKQSVTEYDAAKVFVSLYQGGFEPCRELLRVAFPLFGSEGDEGGRAEQELVHLEQLLSQGVEMGTQVYTSFARSACLPMRIDLAGVDGEAAVQAVFVRTEEAEALELILSQNIIKLQITDNQV